MAAYSVTTMPTAITTGILWARLKPSSLTATNPWLLAFGGRSRSYGGEKMRKSSKNLTITAGGTDEFFDRSISRARKLDRKEEFPAEMRLTFEDPADLLRALTPQRVRVICAVRKRPAPVSDLAAILKRDPSAVKRDVRVLTSLGLLRTQEEKNPGHGRRKIVEPYASRYELVAMI